MNVSDDIKAVLVNNGVDIDGGSFHSWRCFDKERYPEPCTCTDEVVAEVMVVVDAAVAAAMEEERQRINSMLVVDYVREQYERGAADKAAELQDYHGERAHGHYMDGYNAGREDAARDVDLLLAEWEASGNWGADADVIAAARGEKS